ncbi:WXG100 family type VII secretion target [Pseudonocardia lacus]|uniref:WXG100 family type VII secretion target n=1 Tax=Pseudonocardia lacus TaxID=2835865 RepID=UPI001BDC5539|nr:WXG100 family type VII secretion target [Pseudonocardia lacus]
MPEIKVTFGAIDAARADVAGTANRINTRLAELKRMLAPLVASWDGAAAEEYRTAQRNWDAAAGDLAQVLSQIAVALGSVHDGYRQVEQANAARWR